MREIGTHEKAVPGALQRHVLQAQLQAGDLVVLAVGHQPGVGVAAVVAVLHDAREFVDGGGILHGFARAHKFGNAVGSNPLNPLMVVSVTTRPAELMPKSSALWINPGAPSIRMREPLAGRISNMMFQRSPEE